MTTEPDGQFRAWLDWARGHVSQNAAEWKYRAITPEADATTRDRLWCVVTEWAYEILDGAKTKGHKKRLRAIYRKKHCLESRLEIEEAFAAVDALHPDN